MAGFVTWKLFLPLLLILTALNIANAGHPAWETSRVEHPQWLAWEDLEFGGGVRLWPDMKIRYCFSDDDARNKLGHLVRSGLALWSAAGLPDSFTIEEISLEECARHPTTTLTIYRSAHELSSRIGLEQYPGPDDPDLPKARWTENREEGFFEPVVNIAHELGHVFGLLHEMQSNLYWSHRGNRIEMFDWYCERLKDFEDVVEEHELNDDEIDAMCEDGVTAIDYGFSASNWLPWNSGKRYYSHHRTLPTADDVDWKSIMMYPSYLGYEGGQDDHDFNKAIILKSSQISTGEDRWIGRNMGPSALDIIGLKTLYGHTWPVPAPVLHNDPHSPNRAAFQRMAPGCNA